MLIVLALEVGPVPHAYTEPAGQALDAHNLVAAEQLFGLRGLPKLYINKFLTNL
jgi:hypothetical protein